MTHNKVEADKQFVRSKLPWVIAAAGLIVYALTLNSWVSLTNLPIVARITGWTPTPELRNPLFFLLTYPFRFLPPEWIPLAYNLFSLVCAGLILALLARSVVLWPHDRTADQRYRERMRLGLHTSPYAWLPPVLAALVFGLQLSFWEEATMGSGDILDLLIMAYVIRCLLEYRLDEKESWLLRSSFLWAAGMANNWLLFCLFPALMVALIWIRGWSFFNAQFLFRMFICGVAGLLLFLLLPILHTFSDQQAMSFWQALKMNLGTHKTAFAYFYGGARLSVLLSLLLTSLVPILIICIRWASNFGDLSRMGGAVATWVFHLAHAALLVACLWVAFNPGFSPRRLGYSIPALYYLSALSVGYLVGYFLIVFRPVPDRMGRVTDMQRFLSVASQVAIWAVLLLVPAGLVYRNFPQIQISNGPSLKEFAAALTKNLPEQGVLLSDDSNRLLLARAWLARDGRDKNYYFLDTQLLPSPYYHRFQKARHGAEWPEVTGVVRSNRIEDIALLRLVANLGEKYPVVYLNSSFGYYFEYFDAIPTGLTFEMVRYPTNSLTGRPLGDEAIARNEQFWASMQPSLDRLKPFIFRAGSVPTNQTPVQRLMTRLHIPPERNTTAAKLGEYYSQILNTWGVDLQCVNRLDEARRYFESAVALNPDNVPARSNLRFNRDLAAGVKPSVTMEKESQNELSRYRTMQQALQAGGPFDVPAHRLGIGIVYTRGQLFRQAVQQFERVHELVPEHLPTRLWLGQLYTRHRMPDKSLRLVSGLHLQADALRQAGIPPREALHAEAVALFASGRDQEAERLLQEVAQKHADEPAYLATVAQVCTMFRRYTNALEVLDRLLVLRPDDAPILVSHAFLQMQVGRPKDAIPTLTRAIELRTNHYTAVLYRALAYLATDDLDHASDDFDALRKRFPNSLDVNAGLAEIALRRQDTNTAIRIYETALRTATPGSVPFRAISERLRRLQPAEP